MLSVSPVDPAKQDWHHLKTLLHLLVHLLLLLLNPPACPPIFLQSVFMVLILIEIVFFLALPNICLWFYKIQIFNSLPVFYIINHFQSIKSRTPSKHWNICQGDSSSCVSTRSKSAQFSNLVANLWWRKMKLLKSRRRTPTSWWSSRSFASLSEINMNKILLLIALSYGLNSFVLT